MTARHQIDLLGTRLRAPGFPDEDMLQLDQFRRSYRSAYEYVVGTIRDQMRLAPTGRPAKSTHAICDKLRRTSMRLTQMQDIAGCRLVVDDRRQQDELVAKLERIFPECKVVDRRSTPSNGYRAVHVIVFEQEVPVEVQVRTEPQHAWAEYAEKLADTVDPALKYGQGPQDALDILNALSNVAHFVEQMELAGIDQHQKFAAALAEVASRLAHLHRE
jgi:ppGpp synthetase/RelA/SpoT-type nucleotidyltranferase